ncbi:MAG: pyruvate kinase [Anaerolineales bacterium]
MLNGQLKRTKIVATIGPASYDENIMRAIIRAGVNVARINFSHGDHETHAQAIANVRRIAEEEGVVIAVLGDLQGPKIRLGRFDPIQIAPGDVITITLREDFDPAKNEVPIPHPEFVKDVGPGQRLLLDDGDLGLRVTDKIGGTDLVCEVLNAGELKERKGISAPDSRLTLPAITPKDRDDLKFALEQDIDWLAMSFVRSQEDIRHLRWLIHEYDPENDTPIIAKIEKFEALENIEDILQICDGIMVARGDLGVETPAAAVPIHQKRIIKLCNQVGKPVITATQMLNSMITAPRPTRAEASDVANAIFDGTDAVMLSGESASGKYPVEAVEMMATIAAIAEEQLLEHGKEHLRNALMSFVQENDAAAGKDHITADAVSHATIVLAEMTGARMIVCSTWTGYTARRVARERPLIPIIVVTPNPKTRRRLALVWGVQTFIVEQYKHIDEMFDITERTLLDAGIARNGDRYVIIAGVPFGAAGSTNFVKVHEVAGQR